MINERIEYELLLFTSPIKFLATSQPDYLHNMIFV